MGTGWPDIFSIRLNCVLFINFILYILPSKKEFVHEIMSCRKYGVLIFQKWFLQCLSGKLFQQRKRKGEEINSLRVGAAQRDTRRRRARQNGILSMGAVFQRVLCSSTVHS
jgi:hypothetical protein